MFGTAMLENMFSLGLALLVSCCVAQTAIEAPDNRGTEFVAVFMRNVVEVSEKLPQELYVTASNAREVQVTVTSPKFFDPLISMTEIVRSGEVKKFDIDVRLRLDWTGLSRQVLLVKATDDVVVYGVNRDKYSTDGFLIFPTDVVGYEYYTVSYTAQDESTQFAVAALHDNSNVTITLTSQGTIPIRVEIDQKRYTQGDTINIMLQKYEVFQVVSYDKADLTGSHVISTMPVAVFSGNTRTAIGESKSRDHLVVQVPPVTSWGMEYPTVPFPGRTTGDIFRIVGSEPHTVVTVRGLDGLNQYEVAQPGFFVDVLIPSDQYTVISSQKPVLVVQLGHSQLSVDEPGDPTMLLLVATSQYSADYMFATPQLGEGESYTSFLMCIVEKSQREGLLYDNEYFTNLNPVWVDIPESDLVGTKVPIGEGAHALRHQSAVAVFGGYVFGKALHQSYSFQIGQRLASINQPCTPTVQVMGDGIDNDCDGRIDEELCMGDNRGLDTDRDGAIDEDCVRSFEISTVQGAPDAGGRDFLLMFMENEVEQPFFLPLELHITPVRTSSVSVTVTSPAWFEPYYKIDLTVNFGEVRLVEIPYTLREVGTVHTSKAIRVISSADITLYAVNKELYSADAFVVFPIDVLGNEYYAVTHVPSYLERQIGIVGIFDGTLLTMDFPDDSRINFKFNDTTFRGGSRLSVVINRYDTLQIQSFGDLSGTHIQATHRIGVFSGNKRAHVGQGQTRDHLVAMIPPVVSWGTRFCTVPIPARTTGDYFKILASANNTRVVIHPSSISTAQTIHEGQSVSVIIPSHIYAYIEATHPILVTQISQSQRTATEIGDPTMIVLPAIEQWANSYSFATTENAQSVDYANYLMVVVQSDQLDGLLFDGQFMSVFFTTWVPVSNANYSGTFFSVTPGAHTLQHSNPTVTLSAIAYGNADRESYGFPVGLRLAKINEPCITTFSLAGDGIDNDCDGKIDEERCTTGAGDTDRIDDDGDGRFNEDCAIYIPPVTVIQAITTTAQAPTLPGLPGPIGPTGPAGPMGLIGLTGPEGPQGLPGTNGTAGATGPKGEPGAVGAPGLVGAAGLVGAVGATGDPGGVGSPGNDGLPGNAGEVGATGSTGATGAQGVAGTTGLKGEVGAVGAVGPKGEPSSASQGLAGDKGEKGSAGVIGATGPTGAAGVAGNKGGKGDGGTVGSTGAAGATGQIGPTGATGVQGLEGVAGDVGSTGMKGEPGAMGEKGAVGATGVAGLRGFTGQNGSPGAVGSKGEVGPNGATGLQGPKGSPGVSTNGVKGEPGLPGINGLPGTNGQTGAKGDTAPAGATGPKGDSGQDGVDGVNGTKGEAGAAGPPGPAFSGVNECLVANGGCSELCEDTVGGFLCKCSTPGYAVGVDEKTCQDVVECSTNNGGCADMCTNTDGGFTCSCRNGFVLSADGRTCQDFDECTNGASSCRISTYCINSLGSYACIDPTILGAVTSAPAAAALVAEDNEVDFFKSMTQNPRVFFYWLLLLSLCTLALAIALFCGCSRFMTLSRRVDRQQQDDRSDKSDAMLDY